MSDHPTILEVATEIALPPALFEQALEKFGPEETRAIAMTTSVGGIGPLLRDRLFGQAEAGLSVWAVSLLYEAVWTQTIDQNGHVKLMRKTLGDKVRSLLDETGITFSLPIFSGEPVTVSVYRASYGKGEAYFLSAPSITNVVYPGAVDAPAGTKDPGGWAHLTKLKHNWILGRGALQLAKILDRKPDIAVISETPAVFTHHRLFKDAFQTDPFFSQTRYIFNDHTPLEYAHPMWDRKTLKNVAIDPKLYHQSPGWNHNSHHLDLTALIVEKAEGVFGVAQKHAEVMKAMASLKPFSSKISFVTNGTAKEIWQSPEWQAASLSDDQLLRLKDEKRVLLCRWLEKTGHVPDGWADDHKDKWIGTLTRRITPYKRLDVLNQLLENEKYREQFLDLDLVFIVGGRIHQQDQIGNAYAQNLQKIRRNYPDLADRVVFITNFNVWEAPLLYQGTDITIMISDDTFEASATGFMKALMNGAVAVATSDGAVPEFVQFKNHNSDPDRTNGFLIPYFDGKPHQDGLIKALQACIARLNEPTERARHIRASLAQTGNLDIARTVRDMQDLYKRVLSTHEFARLK